MGMDWENILGTTGTGLAEAYDHAVSEIIYVDHPDEEPQLPFDES